MCAVQTASRESDNRPCYAALCGAMYNRDAGPARGRCCFQKQVKAVAMQADFPPRTLSSPRLRGPGLGPG